MTSLGFQASFVLFALLTTVSGQLPIIEVGSGNQGSTYNLSCDARRFNWPSEDSGVTDIVELKVSKLVLTNGQNQETNIWTLRPENVNGPIQRVPQGKIWMIETTTNNGVNNFNTMRLKITMSNPTCDDRGIYKCTVSYIPTTNTPDLIGSQLSRGEELTFTC